MGNGNDEAVVQRALEQAMHCGNMTELSDALGIPRTTLRETLKRNGYYSFESLFADPPEVSVEDVRVLEMQTKHWQQVAGRYEKQLTDRHWLRNEVAGLVSVLKPVDVPRLAQKSGGMQEQVPVLEYSDPHFGLSVPEGQLGVFGVYDSDLAERRTVYAFRKFAEIALTQPFPVRRAKVYLLGDNVEHSHMRPGQAKQTDAHVVAQTIRASNVLSECLRFLCGEFEEVEVEAVPGNHGRTTQKAGENLPDETFDHLVYHIIGKALSEQPNFKINAHQAWYFVDDVLGWKILGLHGEDVLSWSGVPFYGIERAVKDYYMMLGQVTRASLRQMDDTTMMALEQFRSMLLTPDAVAIGHFHNPMVWDIIGVECVANGSLSGVSLYSAKRLRRLTPPSQQMFFVHKDHGIAGRFPIKLAGVK